MLPHTYPALTAYAYPTHPMHLWVAHTMCAYSAKELEVYIEHTLMDTLSILPHLAYGAVGHRGTLGILPVGVLSPAYPPSSISYCPARQCLHNRGAEGLASNGHHIIYLMRRQRYRI